MARNPINEVLGGLASVLNEPVRVLDVGCGAGARPNGKPLREQLPFLVSEMVGVDTSRVALERNDQVDRVIVADIATIALPSDTYDLVVCWDVLEHLPDPVRALDNMLGPLRSGGVMLLAIPNLWSLKGLITKVTPHRFHVWVYRHILALESAGQKGHGPFPTYLRVTPKSLLRWADRNGLKTIDARTHEGFTGFLRRSRVWPFWRMAIVLLRSMTLGRWRPEQSEFLLVLVASSDGNSQPNSSHPEAKKARVSSRPH